jgi:hypothetical protein
MRNALSEDANTYLFEVSSENLKGFREFGSGQAGEREQAGATTCVAESGYWERTTGMGFKRSRPTMTAIALWKPAPLLFQAGPGQ